MMTLDTIFGWMADHEATVWGVGVLSVLTIVGTLVLIPFIIARLPADYFTHHRRPHDSKKDRHPAIHHLLVVAKNMLGILLVLAGIAMLVLPGQGILTLLIGLMLTDFPGKYVLEKRLARRQAVMRSLNWIRAKANQPPLEPPEDGD